MKEFLEKNRAEVKKVSIYEYDREKHIRQEREQAWEEGWEDGISQGEERILRELIRRKQEKGMNISEIAELLEQPEERIRELIQKQD